MIRNPLTDCTCSLIDKQTSNIVFTLEPYSLSINDNYKPTTKIYMYTNKHAEIILKWYRYWHVRVWLTDYLTNECLNLHTVD